MERADIEATLRRLASEVLGDVAADREVTHVAIKVRFVPFFTVTRVHKLARPTRDLAVVQDEAVALLDRVEQDRPVRLLGVRLTLNEPPDLQSRDTPKGLEPGRPSPRGAQ